MLALIAHGAGGIAAPSAVILAFPLYGWAVLAARRRLGSRGPGLWHAGAFVFGSAALTLAVSPLLEVEARLSAHMLQHVLLVAIAAPLVALGLPLARFLCLLGPHGRRRVHVVRRRLERAAGRPLWIALAVHTAAVAVWHVPWLYERAVGDEALHALEHATFFASALVLWGLLLGTGSRAAPSAAKLAALLLLALQGALLGALLAFSTRPWYGIYASAGEDAIADQQLAGLVMWSVGGIAPVVAGFVLVARSLTVAGGSPAPRSRSSEACEPSPRSS